MAVIFPASSPGTVHSVGSPLVEASYAAAAWMSASALCSVMLEKRTRGLPTRSEEHTSELQSRQYLVCRLLLEKKKKYIEPSMLEIPAYQLRKVVYVHGKDD